MTGQESLLRPARLSDAADLQRHCYPHQPLSDVQNYLQWCLAQMAKGRMVRLVADVDGQVIGSGQLAIRRRNAEIGSLVVAPPWRRQGIGTALLKALIDSAQAHGVQALELMASINSPWLQDWYVRIGFSPDGERVLPGDERVVVMRMLLGCPPTGQ